MFYYSKKNMHSTEKQHCSASSSGSTKLGLINCPRSCRQAFVFCRSTLVRCFECTPPKVLCGIVPPLLATRHTRTCWRCNRLCVWLLLLNRRQTRSPQKNGWRESNYNKCVCYLQQTSRLSLSLLRWLLLIEYGMKGGKTSGKRVICTVASYPPLTSLILILPNILLIHSLIGIELTSGLKSLSLSIRREMKCLNSHLQFNRIHFNEIHFWGEKTKIMPLISQLRRNQLTKSIHLELKDKPRMQYIMPELHLKCDDFRHKNPKPVATNFRNQIRSTGEYTGNNRKKIDSQANTLHSSHCSLLSFPSSTCKKKRGCRCESVRMEEGSHWLVGTKKQLASADKMFAQSWTESLWASKYT